MLLSRPMASKTSTCFTIFLPASIRPAAPSSRFVDDGTDDVISVSHQLSDPSQHRFVNGNDEALRRIKTPEFVANWKEIYGIFTTLGFTAQASCSLLPLALFYELTFKFFRSATTC